MLKCEETRPLIGAYLDGELDLAGSLQIEQHLEGCTDCARSYHSLEALRNAVSAAPLYYQAPPALRKRIQASVRQEQRAAAPDRTLRSWFPAVAGLPQWALLAAPVVLLVVAVIALSFARGRQASSQDNLIAQQVLAGSMRSLIVGPLADVQSSDRHTVKPWFAGKLDFSPTVQDYAAQGFPLAGGRLDYVDGHAVAVLVYRHQQHVINLYTWPSPPAAPASLTGAAYQGYNVFHWTQSGMTYWAVSDMDPAELRQFAQLIQKGAP